MSDQKSLLQSIAVREEAIASERETEGIIQTNLGQALHESGTASGGEFIEAVERSLAAIGEYEGFLRRILADEERRKNFLEESKSLKVEKRNLQNRIETALEDLGRASWELWKSGHQPDPRMEEALADLIRADEKLHSAEVAAFRIEKDVSGRGRSVFARGKALLLAGRKKTAGAAMDRQWSKAGRQVKDTVNLDLLADTPASVPIAASKALDRRLDEIAARESDIAGDISEMDAALEEMPGKGGSRKRVSWLEEAIEAERQTLDGAFRDLGRGWVESNGNQAAKGDVERCRQDWLAVTDRIRTGEKAVADIRRHLDYLELKSKRDQTAGRVERLDDEIKSRQATLRGVKKELTALDKELTGLEAALPPLPDED